MKYKGCAHSDNRCVEAPHAPTPEIYEVRGKDIGYECNGEFLEIATAIDEDRAELVCRVVNAHEELLAVAKASLEFWEEIKHTTIRVDGEEEDNLFDEEPMFVKQAKQVLAKAEGK